MNDLRLKNMYGLLKALMETEIFMCGEVLERNRLFDRILVLRSPSSLFPEILISHYLFINSSVSRSVISLHKPSSFGS